MKKLVLLSIATMLSIATFAQLSVTPTSFDATININDSDASLNSKIENLSSKAIKVNWKRSVVSLPSEWINYVCTGSNCYDNLTYSGYFILAGYGDIKDSTLLLTHFEPTQVAGSAVVMVTLTEDGNPTNTVIVTYNVNGIVSATKDLTDKNAISLYPNPTTEYFMIKNKANITKVNICNITGRQVMTFSSPKERYDISDLAGGLYLVQLLDSKNKVVKTTRLSIQRP